MGNGIGGVRQRKVLYVARATSRNLPRCGYDDGRAVWAMGCTAGGGRVRMEDMRLTTLALDVAVVLVFAIAGRASHYDSVTPAGVLSTAWPFAVGLLIAWLAAGRTRWALRSLPAGLLIWPVTLLAGMAIRWLVGDGTATAFVLVAAGVLGLGLMGWRGLAALLRLGRARTMATGPEITGGTT